jgi:hypothetical protein
MSTCSTLPPHSDCSTTPESIARMTRPHSLLNSEETKHLEFDDYETSHRSGPFSKRSVYADSHEGKMSVKRDPTDTRRYSKRLLTIAVPPDTRRYSKRLLSITVPPGSETNIDTSGAPGSLHPGEQSLEKACARDPIPEVAVSAAVSASLRTLLAVENGQVIDLTKTGRVKKKQKHENGIPPEIQIDKNEDDKSLASTDYAKQSWKRKLAGRSRAPCKQKSAKRGKSA